MQQTRLQFNSLLTKTQGLQQMLSGEGHNQESVRPAQTNPKGNSQKSKVQETFAERLDANADKDAGTEGTQRPHQSTRDNGEHTDSNSDGRQWNTHVQRIRVGQVKGRRSNTS